MSAIAIVEVLDENDNPVNYGEFGRMIVTSFTTNFMPLIRYDIGDLARISNNYSLSSSRIAMEFENIVGRSDDVFVTPNGPMFSRFSLFLKFLPSEVVESQIILTNHSLCIDLKYVSFKNHQISSNKFQKFEKIINNELQDVFVFNYINVINLDMGKSGKRRSVIVMPSINK